MNDAVTTQQAMPVDRAERTWTKEQGELLARTYAKGANADELKLYEYHCRKTGLDPFRKQIHFRKQTNNRGDAQIIFITSIEGYRAIANRTGLYAGNDDYRYDEGLSVYEHSKAVRGKAPKTATATVHKIVAGQRVPFTATVRWDEYYPGEAQGFMWRKMPYHMLGKCAEALAIKKAFPEETAEIKVKEEMEQAGILIEPPQQDPAATIRTEDALVELVEKGGKVPGMDRETGEVEEKGFGTLDNPAADPEAALNREDGATVFTIKVTGNTKENKEELKARGYRWNKDRFRWEIGITGDDETRKESDELKAIDEGLILTIVNESNGEKMEF